MLFPKLFEAETKHLNPNSSLFEYKHHLWLGTDSSPPAQNDNVFKMNRGTIALPMSECSHLPYPEVCPFLHLI